MQAGGRKTMLVHNLIMEHEKFIDLNRQDALCRW
jgi:hypothetical protein